ncbi:unnamed protein product [Phytophthora lilii]|uniref:Unnamed protein product n=1 Tax=Phytophthora lilii TaxID=2077276 RepID=A0A9W6WL82_9STRA|nr:unnamed protein product [Phytophthora lilii]
MLSKVTADSSEFHVLNSLLALTPLRSVLAHPYFLSASSTHGTMIHDSPQAAQEQQHIIGILTKQELTKCQTMKRQYLQQIRAWQVQFEKKYRRKAKSADLPAGIVRLQGRSQALNDRIQELNDRLAVAHGSIYRMISGKEALAVDASGVPTQEDSSIQHEIRDESSASLPIESNASRSDSFGRGEGKRSPAQKAFLNRFSSSQ